jgi:hypothetical protein
VFKLIYDKDIPAQLISQIVKNDKIARLIKEGIISSIVSDEIMTKEKADMEVDVLVSSSHISVTIGGISTDNPFIQDMSKDDLFPTSSFESAFFKTVVDRKHKKNLKSQLKKNIQDIIQKNIAKTEVD